MLIGVAKETWPGEVRSALVPANATKLIKSGFSISMESGAGQAAGFTDQQYTDAGVSIVSSRAEVMAAADIFLAVRKPDTAEVDQLKSGAISVSFLDPYNEKALIEALAAKGVTSISMEMIPRSTRAQKMDALSSQANLAGYVTVVQAAYHSPKIMPMMMTPAGTIAPARVFVIGAGVAGLQAIATAKRLGARVEAFDTRPVVAEQVQSLGAKFVEIDLGDVGQTEQGYAKELTPEQLELQREGQKAVIAQSDVVQLQIGSLGFTAVNGAVLRRVQFAPVLRGDRRRPVADAEINATIGSLPQAMQIVPQKTDAHPEAAGQGLFRIRLAVVVLILQKPQVGNVGEPHLAIAREHAGG